MAYIDDVNRVLRDINEVPLTSAQFMNARGLQAFVKEAVNRAYFDVLNENPEWPFLVQHLPEEANSQTTLTIPSGETWIRLADVVSTVDTDNVFLDGEYELDYITFDEYSDNLRREDQTGLPRYVFWDFTRRSLGFYPTPERDYTVHTTAWLKPIPLAAPEDVMVVPDRFYNVVLSKARKYAWQFRGDVNQASLAEEEYNMELRKMFHIIGTIKAVAMRAV